MVGGGAEAEAPPPDDVLVLPPSDHEDGPRAGRAVRLAGALLPLALGLGTFVYAVGLGVGDPRDPGPGLWPAMTSAAIVVCAILLLLRERDERDYEKYSRGALMNIFGVVSLVVYVLLLQYTGVEIATLAVTFFWLKVLGKESWRTSVLLSLAITASVYLLFITVLGAPIPRLLAI